MKDQIILIGGGGHCKACIDVIEREERFLIIGILDIPELVGTKVNGYDIIGTDHDLPAFLRTVKNYLITVGQIKSSSKRHSLYKMVKDSGADLPVVVSPYAYVAKTARIGEGTIIMHHALVNAEAQIGTNCIINSKALVEHEAIIGDFCHISTGAIINGQAKVGSHCFIGSNSIIANNVSIVSNSIISAGFPILEDVNIPGIFKGNLLK